MSTYSHIVHQQPQQNLEETACPSPANHLSDRVNQNMFSAAFQLNWMLGNSGNGTADTADITPLAVAQPTIPQWWDLLKKMRQTLKSHFLIKPMTSNLQM